MFRFEALKSSIITVTKRLPLILFLLFIISHKSMAAENHLFVTGTVMEIDRCASAWLIKRHVDVHAEFDFLTDEELMTTQATSFDTPFSEFRRTHRASTFETIQNKYSLHNERIDYLAALIHEVEINFWNKNLNQEATHFQFRLKNILQKAPDNITALNVCFDYLDSLSLEHL